MQGDAKTTRQPASLEKAALSDKGGFIIFLGLKIKSLQSPHIPLGLSLCDALDILKSVSPDIIEEVENDEKSYRVNCPDFDMAIYETDGKVTSVWYNDPTGRNLLFGTRRKISLYLNRYGDPKGWKKTMNNGWITFYYNEKADVAMAYGNDMDVIRFNDVGVK